MTSLDRSAGDQQHQSPPEQNMFVWRASFTFANCTQLILVGLLLEYLLFKDTRIDVGLQVLAIACILFCMVFEQGWLLLVAIQLSLFFREPSNSGWPFDPGSYLYCFLALAAIAYACSARSTSRIVSRWFAFRIAQLLNPVEPRVAATEAAGLKVQNRNSTLLLRFLTLHAIVILSLVLVTFLPLTPPTSRQWFQRSITNNSILWPGPTPLVATMLMFLILREAAWRQMTTAQAKLWLRSDFFLHHHRDLSMIVRRRSKLSKKALGRSGKSAWW